LYTLKNSLRAQAKFLCDSFSKLFQELQVRKIERKPGNFLCTSEQYSKNYKYKKLNGSQATSSALPNNIPSERKPGNFLCTSEQYSKNYKYKKLNGSQATSSALPNKKFALTCALLYRRKIN